MNNFTSIFEELSKLYEAEELEVADEEIPVEDIPAEEPEADEPKQLVLECENCGALAIKTEDEVTVDEATDLANVDDKCKFCEEAVGYTIVGELVPYEVTEDEEPTVAQESLDEGIMDSFKKLAGKFKQLRTDSKLRKWARQNGGKLASSFKNRTKTTAKDLKAGQYFIPEFELENIDDKEYPAVAYPISKVTEKDIRWVDDKGNDTKVPGIEVSIGDDFFMGILPDMNVYVLSGEEEKSDDLEELLDVNLDARGFGGEGNDVSVL